MNRVFLIISMLFMSIICFAQEVLPPETVDEAVGWLPKLIEKLVAGEYLLAGGVAIMILMVAIRQYGLPKWGIGAAWLPWISAIVGMLSMVGLSMFNNVPFLEALKNGVVMALLGSGTWDMLGQAIAKAILGDKYQEPAKK